MFTTLAWVVLLTALTRPLRQVLRHESTRREPRKPDAVFEDKAEFAIRRVRQARSHHLGNLASYARDAGQKSGDQGSACQASGIRDQDGAVSRSPLSESRHHLAGE